MASGPSSTQALSSRAAREPGPVRRWADRAITGDSAGALTATRSGVVSAGVVLARPAEAARSAAASALSPKTVSTG